MKIIKILGTGCPSCLNTEKVVIEVVKDLNIDAQIIKVTDIQEIMAYDILSTPAVVINDKVVFKGKVPTKEEVKNLLKEEPCCEPGDSCCDSSDNSTCC